MAAPTQKKNQRKPLHPLTVIRLWTRAGGRCQFCNEYLLQDSLTRKEANFSNIAHIVAVSPEGPRGDYPLPLSARDEVENLMLVCRKHHALIDAPEYVAQYPVERLREMKRRHEERILRLTGFDPSNRTAVLRLRANFDAQTPDPIGRAAIEKAIEPRYMQDDLGFPIDLTQIPFRFSDDYWTLAAERVSGAVAGMFAPALARDPVEHISVFALAPIPLLVLLGHCLGSLVPADLYQRHMDTDSWCWKDRGDETHFYVHAPQDGGAADEVAILLSVSGRIDQQALPPEVAGLPLYELTVSNGLPARTRLNTRQDLERFRITYQELLAQIRNGRPGIRTIHLFLAVPAPVAVTCGRELLRKIDPVIRVYDFNKAASQYMYTLKVNEK